MKIKVKLLKKEAAFSPRQIVAFAIVFGLIGGIFLLRSFAAGFVASFEAENATVSGPVTVGNDAAASGGKYLQFGSATGGGSAVYPPKFRYIYDSSSNESAVAANGWNLMDSGSKSSADSTPAGTQGIVWLGDYDNTTCNWEQSDTTVQNAVQAAKGDAKVFGWFISDEPNPYTCTNAPAQHKARSDMIHTIDPSTKVFEVLDTNGFSGQFTADAYQQFPLWKGTADYIGIDPYPCINTGCNFTFMDNVIAAADSAGLPYWGISQAFDGTACGESSWPWPSAANLTTMLNKWKVSNEVGYGTFAWNWSSCSSDLSAHPDLISVLKSFNLGTL